MHILVAPNAFKNSLDATKVAEAISNGLQKSKLKCTITCFPVADGGDGTADLLSSYLKAENIDVVVHDPLKRKIQSSFSWIEKEKTAIIELASASGLRLLKQHEYSPLVTTTYGTGELIIEALNRNARKIIVCIGGSATVDGGTGILRALGMRFFDKNKNEILELPALLSLLTEISLEKLDKRIDQTEINIFCDVQNTLLGVNGAAAVFGPQKGASKQDVEQLEELLTKFRDVTLKQTGNDMSVLKHGGAAGGVAAGLHTFLNASVENGIESFLDITDFENKLSKADLVITGEGSIDLQTLHGKGPYGVAKRAKQRGIPVIGLAGRISESEEPSMKQYFDRLISINEDLTDLETAIKNTYTNLERTARRLGDELSASTVQN